MTDKITVKDNRISEFCKEQSITLITKLSNEEFALELSPNASFLICMERHLLLLLYDFSKSTWHIVLRNTRGVITDILTTDRLSIFGRSTKNLVTFYIKNTYMASRRKGRFEYPLFRIGKRDGKVESKRILMRFKDSVKKVYKVANLTIE